MPDTEKDHARQWLTRQVLSAKTLPEVTAAETALREWIGCYPEEREWMRDAFERLSMMRDIAEEEKEAEQRLAIKAQAA